MSDSLVVRAAATTAEWLYGHYDSDDVHYVAAEASILSPPFFTPCSTPSKRLLRVEWRLLLYPVRVQSGEHLHEFVAVRLENTTDVRASATFKVTLMSEESRIVLCESGEMLGQPDKEETWEVRTLTETSLLKRQLRNLGADPRLARDPPDPRPEKLVVVCSVGDVSTDEEQDHEGDRMSELSAHFESLFETGRFSDVTFNLGKRSMRLHKTILTSASEVFRAMFYNEMREQQESVVDVVDVDFDVMKEMMRYIYARKVNGIKHIAVELFVLADRYDVEGLKRLCENRLCDELNVDNVLSRLELSMRYAGMVNLKAKALDFVLRNLKDLVEKQEFKDLSSDCKDELFRHIATKIVGLIDADLD